MIELVDTHCHLDSDSFRDDREQIMERSSAAGVTRWIVPSLSFRNTPNVLALTDQWEGCYAGVGIYPRYCRDWKASDIDRVREAAGHPKVVAIGEVGLDYMFNVRTSRETQHAVLAAHLELAAELGLPVILHNRDLETYADTLRLVGESPLAGRDRVGVLHHFCADYDTALRAIDLGLYLSIAGPVTYLNARKLPALVSRLPLERLVLETDAPCMPPHPYRGTHRSEPAHVLVIAEAVAAMHGTNVGEIARITTMNALRLFALECRT